MLKKYILPEIFFILSILCGVLYQLNGSYIDSNGMLHESFGFIPLGYLFLFASIISCLIITIVSMVKKHNLK